MQSASELIADKIHYARLEVYHFADMIERKESELDQCRQSHAVAKAKLDTLLRENPHHRNVYDMERTVLNDKPTDDKSTATIPSLFVHW